MKKTNLLTFSMFLVLSLAACSGQNTEPLGKTDTNTVQTEQVEQTEQQTETDPAAIEQTIDNSQNTLKMVWKLEDVPRPSDSGGTSNGENEVSYSFVHKTKEDAEKILNNYEMHLDHAGFESVVTKDDSDDQIFTATSGNATVKIHFYKEESAPLTFGTPDEHVYGMEIYIFVVTPDIANADLTLDEFDSLIPALPDVQWYDNDFENNKARWKHHQTSQLEPDEIVAYVDALKNSGYTIDIEEAPEGNEDHNAYYFSALNPDGIEVRVSMDTEEDMRATTISIGIKK